MLPPTYQVKDVDRWRDRISLAPLLFIPSSLCGSWLLFLPCSQIKLAILTAVNSCTRRATVEISHNCHSHKLLPSFFHHLLSDSEIEHSVLTISVELWLDVDSGWRFSLSSALIVWPTAAIDGWLLVRGVHYLSRV